jgi:transposase
MTADLLELAAWLKARGIQHVAMESTGVYWKPVWNILEAEGFDLLLANAQEVKIVPGRKTDQKDSQWIADLHQHGLLRKSFVPPRQVRDLRDLTRTRATLAQDHPARSAIGFRRCWRMPTSSWHPWPATCSGLRGARSCRPS